MSNFLNQFEQKNYKEVKDERQNLTKNNQHATDEIKEAKTTGKMQQQSRKDDEIIEIDKTFMQKQKRKKIIVIISSIIAICLVFTIILFINMTSIPNFINKKQSDLEAWAKENNMTLNLDKIYSKQVNQDTIISQEPNAGNYILKGSTVKFVISKGADPNEYVSIPDLSQMNHKQIEEWIASEKLTNTKVETVYDAKISEGKLIEAAFEDKEVTKATFKRKDILKITVSKGAKPVEKNIVVPDFKGKLKSDVEAWSKTNQVKITFKEKADDKVNVDSVISQSVVASEKVSTEDVIEITISLGKGVKVPDFSTIAKTDAEHSSGELQIVIKEVYSNLAYGKFIKQNVEANTILTGENKKVEVSYSIGRPFVENLTGKNLKEVEKYFSEMNDKGANISYQVIYETVSDPQVIKGTVIRSNISNSYITFGGSVIVYIAR